MIWYFTQKIFFQMELLAAENVNLDKSIIFKSANFPIPNKHVVGTKFKHLIEILRMSTTTYIFTEK